MALNIVDTPNRGKVPETISDEVVAEYVENLPNVPEGKGLRDDAVNFKSQASATGYGRKLISAIAAMEPETYLSANTNDKGERLIKLGLTVRQINGQWTCAVRNWDR